MTVILYSKPGCQPCRITKMALLAQNVDFEEIDVSANTEAARFVSEELGYRSMPVVYFDQQTHWSGYRPESIKSALRERSSA